MIDDGEFAGVPIGGLGTGSIGRTHRGDVARWHLEVGRHRHEPVAADGFSIFVGGPDGTPRRPSSRRFARTELPGWGWDLPGGRRHVSRALPAGLAGLRARRPRRPRSSASSCRPVIAGDLDASALPVGVFEWWIENPGPDPLTVGLMFTWADPSRDRAGRAARRRHDIGPRRPTCGGVRLRRSARRRSDRAARDARHRGVPGGDGVDVSARAAFDPIADDGALGRLRGRRPARRPAIGPRPSAGRRGDRRRPSRRPSTSPPASGGRSGSRSRGTCRWSSSGPAVAGGSATPATGAGAACGPGTWPRTPSTRCPTWRAAIEAWQAPVLADPERPAWYKTALFNELYFLVDGGTFWEHGEVGDPEPPADHVGPVRAARVPRLPVLRHGRRRLLRVVRDPRAVPGARDGAGSATCSRRSRSTTRRS